MIKKDKLDTIIKLYKDGLTLEKVGKRVELTGSAVNYHLKKNNILVRKPGNAQRNKGYGIDKTFFENINSHEKAAVLGFICADGCNDMKNWKTVITIHPKDIDYLEKINNLIQPNKKNSIIKYNYTTKDGKISKRAILIIYSIKICQDLNKIGCKPRKSLTLDLPNLKEEYFSSFMAGFFDGDGCLTHNKNDYQIQIASSDLFCFKAKSLIEKILDINVNVYKKGKISIISIGGNNQVEKFMDWIYLKTSIKLNRKWDKYLKMKNYLNKRKMRHRIKK